jgi:hypothetical protein
VEKITIRAPAAADWGLAPPLIISLAMAITVTWSPIVCAIGVGIASYLISLWHRIAELKATGG